MQFHAEILARDEEGAMERILRVFRHRGYVTKSLQAICDQEQHRLHLKIIGESDRPLSQLSLQIEKLYEVIEVTVSTLPSVEFDFEFENRGLNQGIRRPVYASSSRG
jgi:acetolactate synthase II small subunit